MKQEKCQWKNDNWIKYNKQIESKNIYIKKTKHLIFEWNKKREQIKKNNKEENACFKKNKAKKTGERKAEKDLGIEYIA